MLALIMASITMSADSYSYLVFRQTGGSETSLTASKLKITFADGNAVATTADGTVKAFALSDLSAMYFSNTNTGAVTDISATANPLEQVAVFSMMGVQVATGTAASVLTGGSLDPGVYVVKSNSTTYKILVR